MSNRDPDFWLRELARNGLSPADQKELLITLSKAVETRERFPPNAPVPYLSRARQFLAAAFFPQKGPLFLAVDPSSSPELLSRS